MHVFMGKKQGRKETSSGNKHTILKWLKVPCVGGRKIQCLTLNHGYLLLNVMSRKAILFKP